MHLARQPLTLAHKILIAIAMCRSWAMFIDDETFMIIASCKKHCNMLIIHIWIRQDSWIFIEDSSFMAGFQECLSQMSKKTFLKKSITFRCIIVAMINSAGLRGFSASLDIDGCSVAHGVQQEVDMWAQTLITLNGHMFLRNISGITDIAHNNHRTSWKLGCQVTETP